MAALPLHRRVLGTNVRALRTQAGWSIERLAEKADLHPNYVGGVERGTENISMDTLVRLAKALNARLRDLVGEL